MSAQRGPFLLCGLAKTGKTPLGLALAAHSQVALSQHCHLWTRHFRRHDDLSHRDNLDRCIAALLKEPGIRAMEPDLGAVRRTFSTGEASYPRLFAAFHEHYASRIGKQRWGMQEGLAEAFADVFLESYPTARIVHMVRDPRDLLKPPHSYVRRNGKLGWGTARWLFSANLAQRNARLYAGRYLVVRYEALEADPAGTIGSVMSFLGEEPDADVIAALPPIPVSQEEHRDGSVASIIEGSTRHELELFGYPVGTREGTSGSLPYRLLDRPLHMAGMLAWKAIGARHLTAEVSR